MFCNISPSTSEDCIIARIWLITEDSLRIRPMTMHQSKHPASMKICSKYLERKHQGWDWEEAKLAWGGSDQKAAVPLSHLYELPESRLSLKI